jgi:hypothetical protein
MENSDNQPQPQPKNEPDWLHEFEDLANRELEAGASCEQVHPIVKNWFEKLLQQDPPASRDSVMQAMACLSTEVMNTIPDDLFDSMMEFFSEDELGGWIEYVLMVGRAFEISLRGGELDDL